MEVLWWCDGGIHDDGGCGGREKEEEEGDGDVSYDASSKEVSKSVGVVFLDAYYVAWRYLSKQK